MECILWWGCLIDQRPGAGDRKSEIRDWKERAKFLDTPVKSAALHTVVYLRLFDLY